MQKFCFTIALVVSLFMLQTFAFALDNTELISETAVLIDADTAQILYTKGADNKMYPASTTKVLTALLAVETLDPTETGVVSEKALDIDEWDSASMGLIKDEVISADSLLYGLMLPSANDAANVLAEMVSGSQSDFVDLMNERASQLGLKNTHFSNPHGLHDDNHYTTAHDMALITREAVQNPQFLKYFGAAEATLPPTNLTLFKRVYVNFQQMLVKDSAHYDARVLGGKVGYTHEANHTMTTYAENDGRRLIAVVMGSKSRDEKFIDTAKLLEFGFSEFNDFVVPREDFSGFKVPVYSGNSLAGTAVFKSKHDFKALLHTSVNLDTLSISYSPTTSVDLNDEIRGFASFSVVSENPSVPAFIGEAVLDYEVFSADSPDAPRGFVNHIYALFTAYTWLPWALVMFMLLVFAGGYFTSLKFHERLSFKREVITQERIEQELEIKEKKPYKGPTPIVGKHFIEK